MRFISTSGHAFPELPVFTSKGVKNKSEGDGADAAHEPRSLLVGYWVGDLMARYGQSGVFCMIGAAMLAIIVGVGVFGPRTNGRSLEVLSP
ncbi:MAG TPA: hypothetical protein VMJ11_01100 [Paraburkholderia sp.]|uniref:hypothetical protein n=1 Tax=Paraburkholderia sp. TaxID=1926495 RepID=UPI002B9993E0|nr:hypothetical protein [Paraburkholderia sp.]HTR05272.1 hypothetical protein [Paraburkholderia sp.]